MKYSVHKTFENAKGETFKNEGVDETFKSIVPQVLLADVDGNGQPVKGPEKLKRYDLWIKIRAAQDEVELTSDEIQTLSSAAELFSTVLYGQIKYFLEQKG